MTSGVARALIAAMKNQTEPRPVPSDSVFGNPQRRRVFQYLCVHPCGSLTEAAAALGISHATVRFHVLRLSEAKYLISSAHGFYPTGFVDAGDLPLFEALGTSAARKVLAIAYAREGLPLSEIAREAGMTRQAVASFLNTVELLGLVTRVTDGKYVRVYPTRLLEDRRERHRPRARHFVDGFLRRLAADGEAPEVLRRDSSECTVRFGRGAAKAVLELVLEPHAHILR